ncbi:hypothetical protein AK812_SmicGene24685 [Symbiodinium microadriaticum]|uniref:Uncharacterized protein n=1 Tax=Symbiodinium microadriaticum TaxID=2951 RepID=A0A1Q9DDW0_SYMMI|nr:hypothetical protein AK812_SmicGene24685 [Symbiodinium microadriaticum]
MARWSLPAPSCLPEGHLVRGQREVNLQRTGPPYVVLAPRLRAEANTQVREYPAMDSPWVLALANKNERYPGQQVREYPAMDSPWVLALANKNERYEMDSLPAST